VLIVESNCAGNGLGQGESGCLCGYVLESVPLVLCDMLGDKRVLGGDEGEVTEVLLLVFLVFLPQNIDTVNHLLYKLNLRVSKSVLVGNVISEACLSTRFSTGSTGLKVELFASGLEGIHSVLGPSWKVNMDRGSHTSTKVGWAGVNVSVVGVKAEVLSRLLLD